MEILEKIKKPNLEIKVKQKNTLKHLEYYSFEERVFDLASLFKKSLNEEYTNIIGSNVYVSREFEEKNKVFNGVYKLASIENYMGFIPDFKSRKLLSISFWIAL